MLSVAVLFLLSIFIGSQWDYLCRQNVDIDLNSGICRYRYYFWIIPTGKKIYETEYSNIVQKYSEKKEIHPNWHNDVQVGSAFLYFTTGGELTSACHEFAIALLASDYDELQKERYIRKSLTFLRDKDYKGISKLSEELNTAINGDPSDEKTERPMQEG